jgi:AAA domain
MSPGFAVADPGESPSARDILKACACRNSRCTCYLSAEVGHGNTHCPCHKDPNPSLTVSEKDGKVLWHCKAGCSQDSVASAIRQRPADTLPSLSSRSAQQAGTASKLVAVYDYVTAAGRVAQKGRFEDEGGNKSFKWRWKGSSSWDGWHNQATLADFGLWGADLLGDRLDEPVILCEGEKATQACRAKGLLSVCLPGGATQQDFGHALEPLRGRVVWPWPDNDDAGRDLMGRVRMVLDGEAAEVQIINVFDVVPLKGDADDFFKDHSLVALRDRERAGTLFAPYPAPGGPAVSTGTLRFRTAREIAEITPEWPDFLVEGLVAVESITEVDAKVKAGKSRLASGVACILAGRPFLERPTRHTPVVWLTEERDPTMRELLGRCGLLDTSELHILELHQTRGLPWPEIVLQVEEFARSQGATLVIVDTLGRWADLTKDEENDAGAAAAAMKPLEDLAAHGFAVVVARHDRKSGGELGDSARGSSGFAGAADIIVHLTRGNTNGHATRRTLECVGRFDAVPPRLVVEFSEGRYVLIGDANDAERKEARQFLLDYLPTAGGDEWRTEEDLVDLTEEKQVSIGRSTLQRATNELIAAGRVARKTGFGKTGRAYGYQLARVSDSPDLTDHISQKSTAI